ncbi:MAG: PEGA domain-containing protein [Alphaproteobacteria bacterium]|nr:PEGA domain-containing protein [Alphaproteobacteria bacterium]
MKTCPVCSETYSERIDFCFLDGAVLTLMPSALDAPVPRMVAQQAAEATAGRLRTERTEEIEVPTPEVAPPPRPASADEAPLPRAITDEAELPASAPEPAPPPPPPRVAPPPIAASPPPLFDEAEVPAGRVPGRRESPLMWFAGAAVGVMVLVLLAWQLQGAGSPKAPARPKAPTPVPAAVIEPTPRAPEPEIAPEPEAAPEVVAPPDVVEAPPPRPPPVVHPVRPSSSNAPRATDNGSAIGTATQVGSHITPPVRGEVQPPPVARAPAEAAASPWDAPTEPKEATASFVSDPPGAVVRVDGRLRGKTPLDVKLPMGAHEVSLELDGYTPLTRSVDVAVEAPKFPFTLKPVVRSGNVLVVAPGWDGATLLVDGDARGQLPTQVMLTEGAHTFQVVLGDRRAKEQRIVQLTERGLTRVTLDLQ